MISFQRTTTNSSRPGFVVDQSSIVRGNGRQIDWDLLDGRYVPGAEIIEVTANADIDDVALAVVALPYDVPAGTVLDFGLREAVTIVLSGNEAIGQTAIGIAALTAPLRSGTILKSSAGEFMQLTADAAAGDLSLTVEALEVAWESADTATAPAVRQLVYVTADAEAGDEELTVAPLDFWVNDGATATLGLSEQLVGAGKQVLAGTVMDLLSSGKVVPSALATGGVTAYGILETNADEFSRSDAASGYGVIIGGAFYDNLLPEASGDPAVISSTWKTELLARGGAWQFEQYADDTA